MVAGQGAWMIADVDRFTQQTTDTYVLVNVSDRHPQFFIAPGKDLRGDVHERHEQFMARVGTRPRNSESKHTKIKPRDVEQWKDLWSAFD